MRGPLAPADKRRLRAVIVDDERPARELIARLLADEHDVTIVGECSDGREAVALLRGEAPDLVFLDIQMPHFDGFEVLKQLNPRRFPLVIFVTAYDQYAVKAFEYHAQDYLLKPFRRERFREALSRIREQWKAGRPEQNFARFRTLLEHWETPSRVDAVAASPASQYLQRVFVKTGKSSASLEVNLIDWIKSVDHFVELHSRTKSYLVYASIGDIERKLNPWQFLRIHRTAIVNVAAVREFRIDETGACFFVLRDGNTLRVSRSRQRQMRMKLKNYQSA